MHGDGDSLFYAYTTWITAALSVHRALLASQKYHQTIKVSHQEAHTWCDSSEHKPPEAGREGSQGRRKDGASQGFPPPAPFLWWDGKGRGKL